MKKILVPTDYSDCSDNALDVAKALAIKSDAELFIIHFEEVMPDITHVVHHMASENDPYHIGHARYLLQKRVDLLTKEGLKAKAIFVPHEGREAIEDYIKPYSIDFVVMGSHGAKGIKSIIGSNTQRMIRHASVPVLVVKRPDKNFNPNNILFASTFREDVSKPLHDLVAFAALWNAELDLVFLNMLSHLIEEQEAKRLMVQQMGSSQSINFTLNISETNDEEWGISKFARMLDSDLIAVVYDTHTGFNRLFNASVAEKLINHEEMPVLVMSHP